MGIITNPKGAPQNLKPFKKGQSGNPGGKPKGHEELRELARSFTLDAVNTLASICKNPKVAPSSRVTAATVLLERGWGKPVQQVEVKRTPFDELSRDELLAIERAIEDIAQQEGGLAGGHSGPAVEGPPPGVSTLQ